LIALFVCECYQKGIIRKYGQGGKKKINSEYSEKVARRVKTPRFPRGFAKTALEIARQSGHKWPVFTLRPRLLSAVRDFFRYSFCEW
jgi:hypothetical protein